MHEKSAALLNKAVADEMAAIHQYMYFHFHCDDQGYELLASLFKKTAIEEMMHIERIAERILFVGGDVALAPNEEVATIRDVKEMLEFAVKSEQEAIRDYNLWALESANNADSVTKQLFESLVADEERHYDQFATELENMQKFGENYLALQSMERSKANSAPGGGEG